MAVLVPDHLDVLGVVDPAGAERDLVDRAVVVGVVVGERVDLDPLALGVHVVEAEPAQVGLGSVHGVVGVDHLEPVRRPAVLEHAVLAHRGVAVGDPHPAPPQRVGLQVVERDGAVSAPQDDVLGVLVVGERLVLQGDDGVGVEDPAGALLGADVGGHPVAGQHAAAGGVDVVEGDALSGRGAHPPHQPRGSVGLGRGSHRPRVSLAR
ncbi:MAG: hypothetical protein R2731_11740 [Nocardioides sp.]